MFFVTDTIFTNIVVDTGEWHPPQSAERMGVVTDEELLQYYKQGKKREGRVS
jgi:hypothetical protein